MSVFEVKVESCINCGSLYDDSDGPEYGPSWYRCSKKPHMENLKAFPFRTPQKCFEVHWSQLVDWEAEAAKEGQILSEENSL